ncbi:putative potassium channel regulatory protein-like [Apostichopus japonicus]|uniref:Putative potassium channel regulatory protein-like n=1 Tax=Stichopus japonicus TaxID=307972 RepID=A0A2G8KED8_STIJA|nr:putative potassium channel regulatory protein-like [Apostichopus japonicus]
MDEGSGTVYLNVGGNLYTTTLSVLKSDQESFIGKMFSRKPSEWTIDRNGNVFIDRDGSLFRYILNFLRDDQLIVPTKFAEFDLLLQEAKFYKLKKLEDAILQLMSCRKIIVFLQVVKPRTSSTEMLKVTAKEHLSKELKEKLKFALINNRRSEESFHGYWANHYAIERTTMIKTFLTEQGFEVSEQQASLVKLVKDL